MSLLIEMLKTWSVKCLIKYWIIRC